MGKKGGGSEAKQARKDEEARQARIREGTTRVNGIFDGQFNDDFFNGRRDAYLDYAKPQLEDQYGDAQKELTYALARSGTLDSSIRGEKVGELQKLYDLNSQQIADQALASSTSSRTAVEDARANLIATLNATGDAEGAANSAIARSAALSQPAAFDPITSLFVDFTNALGTKAAADRAEYYANGGVGPGGGATYYGSSRNSVKVK